MKRAFVKRFLHFPAACQEIDKEKNVSFNVCMNYSIIYSLTVLLD